MTTRLTLIAVPAVAAILAAIVPQTSVGQTIPQLAPAGPERRSPRLVAPDPDRETEADAQEQDDVADEGPVFPEAPEWAIAEWLQGDPGALADQAGQVVLIHFFQMWCPACNAVTQPLFAEWDKRYGERDDVTIVSIHTVFEGHEQQTAERLRAWVAEKGIGHPVGIDAYADPGDSTPITMQRYDTGGTPQVVVVDREGRIRFDRFGSFERVEAEALIDAVLAEGAEDGPDQDDANGEQDDAPQVLAGRYQVFLKQFTRTCGRARGGLNLKRVYVTDEPEAVAIRFPVPYHGRRDLTLPFDAEAGEIHHRTEERMDVDGMPTTVLFEVDAWRTAVEPPRFEYEFTLEQVGDRAGTDCRITGGGWAERTFR